MRDMSAVRRVRGGGGRPTALIAPLALVLVSVGLGSCNGETTTTGQAFGPATHATASASASVASSAVPTSPLPTSPLPASSLPTSRLPMSSVRTSRAATSHSATSHSGISHRAVATANASATRPAAASATPSATAATTPVTPPPSAGPGRASAPLVVLDPGHSVPVSATDPRTGLSVSEYENEPEMHDVFKVARIVGRTLRSAGYRVIFTKKRVDQPRNLAQRAYLANRVHADLALSIHDQAGANGGIGFDAGNNIVYYQSVGTYRETPGGHRVYFTDRAVAALSRRYGRIFQAERRRVEGHPVRLQGNVGYNLGSRGLAPGNIWVVQLLADVPWIYNEAGGNSAGRVGLSPADRHRYAAGLVAAVERCLPLPR